MSHHNAQTKNCQISGKEFLVTKEDLDFLDQLSPVINREKAYWELVYGG